MRIPAWLHMVIRTEGSTGQNMKVQTLWFPWRPCSLPWKRQWFKKEFHGAIKWARPLCALSFSPATLKKVGGNVHSQATINYTFIGCPPFAKAARDKIPSWIGMQVVLCFVQVYVCLIMCVCASEREKVTLVRGKWQISFLNHSFAQRVREKPSTL